MLCILKAAIGWVILMLVGTNLLGLVVRGLVPTREEKQLDATVTSPAVRELMAQYKRSNVGVTLFFLVVALAFLYALLRIWNAGVLVAAMMLMASRLPDLLWEMESGKKVTRTDGPKGIGGLLANFLTWGALPVLWYGLCRM